VQRRAHSRCWLSQGYQCLSDGDGHYLAERVLRIATSEELDGIFSPGFLAGGYYGAHFELDSARVLAG